jgi:RHS repeat-associated protein
VLNRALHDGPGYAGREEDAATGLVYMQQRYYDPESGTFLSADPVEANPGAGFNRHAYAANNPYRFTDPDGRSNQQVHEDNSCTGSRVHCPSATQITQINPPSPVSSVEVLGKKVAVHYDSNVLSDERSAVSSKISAAADVINTHTTELSEAQKYTIQLIHTVLIAASSAEYLGQIGHSMKLSTSYIKRSSAAWLASLWGHEGQHYLNTGKYTGANLWRDEQTASLTQLGIGRKVGFTQAEVDRLERWSADSNRDDMQRHMEEGLEQ